MIKTYFPTFPYISLLLLFLYTLSPVTTTDAIIPIPPCDARIGLPGGVYTCPVANFQSSSGKDCEWHEPTDCISWGDDAGQKPSSIGPDGGGVCALYDGVNCVGEMVR
jgi:hypothetical protein